MHPDCDVFESKKAFQRAKENVEKYYAVVAVLEEMNKSLFVFEKYIPRFFRSARNVYEQVMRERSNTPRNRNIYKPKIPKEVRNSLVGNFSVEIEFYEFCRARLQKQYLAVL